MNVFECECKEEISHHVYIGGEWSRESYRRMISARVGVNLIGLFVVKDRERFTLSSDAPVNFSVDGTRAPGE